MNIVLEAATARYDGHFVNGHVAVVEDGLHERVPGLVVGRQLLLVVVHQAAALAPELHLLARVLDVGGVDLLAVPSRRKEGGLVEKVRQVGARKAGRAARDDP
jgi:hypothetical protein